MRLLPAFSLTTLLLTAAAAFAQLPAFTAVNHGLDATFSNTGKGIFDPQVAGLTGVAFGNGLFVAVGASGNDTAIRWATSPDGTTWTARSQAAGGDLKTFSTSRVHFLNGKFLFFTELTGTGGGGFAYSSADGLTWTRSNVITTGRMLIVEFDASPTLTVAASTNGAQYASADLVTWVSRPVVANASGFDHLDLAYGAGKFFSSINGFGGTTYTSGDGTAWTAIPQANNVGGSRVAAGNGVVLLSVNTNRFRTTDGTTFSPITTVLPTGYTNFGGDQFFAGGRFITQNPVFTLTGTSAYLASVDGTTWTAFATAPQPPTLPPGQSRSFLPRDIAFGNGKYILAGTDSSQSLTASSIAPLIWILDASAVPTPAVITTQPVAQTISTGGTAVFTVAATGATSYQWKLNGSAISGATSATLVIRNAGAANAGSYTVDAISSSGNATSNAVTLTLSTTTNFGRISNLSVLTDITAAAPSFTVGTVIGGGGTSGNKAVVVRAVGPSLGALGVPGTITDPQLTVFNGASVAIASNDNWGGGSDLLNAMAGVGAFAFTGPTSKDAAIAEAAAPAGSYSVAVSGVGGATGSVIAEIYDATPASAFTTASTRLTNVSVLKAIPANGNLTLGFTIGGGTAKTVLIRAIGPGLSAVGVNSGTLADPTLTLFNSSSVAISSNDNWGGDAQLTTVGTAVGAFAVSSATSKDAMLLVTLPPGGYTAQAAGIGGSGGLAIVEVYEVP